VPRPDHAISRAAISRNALKVMYRLHGAGFLGYMVGGAVRDLLLGRTPKDFDVATNARPQQVRQLFRNARLIGRRFRLALITFADEIVEVATFRRSPEPPDHEEAEATEPLAPVVEADEFGTPEEDAWRRDFTVNGLFYNIADFSVIDHVGGLADLDAGVIRTIGDPPVRFTEDPVRMMRAIEYSARLGFAIDESTAEAIAEMQPEIRRAAPARIAYELLESLEGGHAEAIFRGLELHGLLEHVVPEARSALVGGRDALLFRLLRAADRAVGGGKETVAAEAVIGALFLPSFLRAVGAPGGAPLPEKEASALVREFLDPPALRLALSNHRAHLLRHAYAMLPRLTAPPRSTKVVLRSVRHEAFPAAWQLVGFLAEATGRHGDAIAAWRGAIERLRHGQPAVEEAPAGGAARKRPRRRRRGRTRRKPVAAPVEAASP
jgi:poly(A) polymerase